MTKISEYTASLTVPAGTLFDVSIVDGVSPSGYVTRSITDTVLYDASNQDLQSVLDTDSGQTSTSVIPDAQVYDIVRGKTRVLSEADVNIKRNVSLLYGTAGDRVFNDATTPTIEAYNGAFINEFIVGKEEYLGGSILWDDTASEFSQDTLGNIDGKMIKDIIVNQGDDVSTGKWSESGVFLKHENTSTGDALTNLIQDGAFLSTSTLIGANEIYSLNSGAQSDIVTYLANGFMGMNKAVPVDTIDMITANGDGITISEPGGSTRARLYHDTTNGGVLLLEDVGGSPRVNLRADATNPSYINGNDSTPGFGIGVATPLAALDVRGSGALFRSVSGPNTVTVRGSGSNAILELDNSGAAGDASRIDFREADVSKSIIEWNLDDQRLTASIGATDIFTARSGNFGVNTINPQETMHIDGTIRVDNQEAVSAGSATGTFLIVNIDGTQRKIALLADS